MTQTQINGNQVITWHYSSAAREEYKRVENFILEPGEFSEDPIREALLYTHNVLEGCSMPFVVLGNIAYQLKHGEPLHGHKVVLGIHRRYCLPESTSLLPVLDPTIEQLTDGWRIVHQEVPVYIKVYDKLYPTLIDPDIVFYAVETFNIPNPFDVYWAGPHLDV